MKQISQGSYKNNKKFLDYLMDTYGIPYSEYELMTDYARKRIRDYYKSFVINKEEK